MMMMMIISAIALERHQPFDQRTMPDIRLIVICILPRALCQSVSHFPKNLFCLKISFSIMRFCVYLFDQLRRANGEVTSTMDEIFSCLLCSPIAFVESFSTGLTPLTSTLPFMSIPSFFFFLPLSSIC